MYYFYFYKNKCVILYYVYAVNILYSKKNYKNKY